MDIDLIYGVITSLIGNEGGEIKVKAFRNFEKKDKGLVFDEVEICNEFPQSGCVYDHKLNSNVVFCTGDLIEIEIKQLFPAEDDPKRHRVLHHLKITKYGARLFHLGTGIFRKNELSINLDYVEQEIKNVKNRIHDSTTFYITDKINIYGPLKCDSGKILPKTGKEVGKFPIPELIIDNGNQQYLFTHPKKSDQLEVIDCMDRKQILEWLKGKIKDFGDFNLQINQIEVGHELDKIRFDRVQNFITGLDYNFQEIKRLSKLTEEWGIVFNSTLIKYETEFEKEARILIDPRLKEYEKSMQNEIDSKKSDYEKELQVLQKNKDLLIEIIEKEEKVIEKYIEEVELLKMELDTIEKSKMDLLDEVNYIADQKERLINDIKIHFQILNFGERKLIEPLSIPTFDEQVYLSDHQLLYDNYEQMLDVTRRANIGKIEMFESTFHGLLTHNYLLAKDEKLIIYFAKLFGKSKVIIQQVEPDWIKFEKLYNNGLATIWESATKNPDQFHFFILQDINLASIECYAKPLLDVISGIRTSIPGFKNTIPTNLYIIGIPLKVGLNGEFGLNLYKDTFEKWGVLKDFEVNLTELKKFNPSKILSQNTVQDMLDELGFSEDQKIHEDFFEEYNA